jgi:hypothetical protein
VSVGVGVRLGVRVLVALEVAVGVADGDGVGVSVPASVAVGVGGSAGQPKSDAFTAWTSSATVTAPSPSASARGQLETGRKPRAMFTPRTSSSTVTARSSPQSPGHAPAGENTSTVAEKTARDKKPPRPVLSLIETNLVQIAIGEPASRPSLSFEAVNYRSNSDPNRYFSSPALLAGED